MPSLAEKECVDPSDCSEIDESQPCSEQRKPDVSSHLEWLVDDESVAGDKYLDYGVSMGDKADSGKGPEDCGVLTALSQSTSCGLTSTQPDGGEGAAKEGNREVVTDKKYTVINDVGEDGQRSEKTGKGVYFSEDKKKSEDGEKQGMEVDAPDVDGGWAFMVVLGSFIIMVVLNYLQVLM